VGAINLCSADEIHGEIDMADNAPETLERFGGEFQAKILSLLIRDHSFVRQIFDILDPEYFESDSRKWIVQTCGVPS